MSERVDWYKFLSGTSEEADFNFPGVDDTFEEMGSAAVSRYPLRLFGATRAGRRVTISEEQRPHAYIIGSTRQGKSKFIEHLIRGDIRRGIGCCLLDPSAGGSTVYEVLRWCCWRGLKKVILIDPSHAHSFGTVCGLQPLLYGADGKRRARLRAASIEDIRETARVLYGVSDPASTPRIERYLDAVIYLLYNAGRTLSDAEYFTNRKYLGTVTEILSHTPEGDHHRATIEEAFANPRIYTEVYQSTVTRLLQFVTDTLRLMFSVERGVDFMEAVSEGYVLLVNLDTASGVSVMESRLIGTLIINSIITAGACLFEKSGRRYRKPYYLYVDEAGEYATEKLARTMELKQKTGLKVTIGHQSSYQFKESSVWNRILNVAYLKVMFDTPGRADRDRMSREYYGGQITEQQASYANANLPVQEATIKPAKGEPVRVRTPDVPPAPVSDEQLRQYIEELYCQPFYYEAAALRQRLAEKRDGTARTQRTDPAPARPGAANDRGTHRAAGVPDGRSKTSKWKSVS